MGLGATNAVEVQSGAMKTGDWFVDKTAPPTAAITPSSGYFGADEDDVMNNIFNHYAVPITNAAGQPTGHKVLYKDDARRPAPRSSSSPSRFLRLRWSPTWPSSSQEPGLSSTLTTLAKSISLSPILS